MKKYIVLNDKGYPQMPIYFTGDDIPKTAIEISDQEEYHYLNGEFKNAAGEWAKIPAPEPTAAEKLVTAKQAAEYAIREQLTATDYKCLKYVDGDLTAAEYQETKAERQALREKFNAVEACTTIKELEKLLG